MDNKITDIKSSELIKVTQLLHLVWGGDYSAIESKTMWAFGKLNEAKVLVIRDSDNSLISVRGGMRWPLRIDDTELKVYQFHGTCVHPDFRRQGVFSKINKEFVRIASELGFHLIFNVSVNASKLGYEKIGWKYLNGFRRLTKFNRPINILRNRGGEKLNVLDSKISKKKEIDIYIPQKFLDAREVIFKALIHTGYTQEFLNWRLSNSLENYKILHLPECIIIYKINSNDNLRELIIGEILMLNKKYSVFRSSLKKLFNLENPDLTYTYIFNTHPLYNFYLRSLFSPNPINYNLNFGVRELNQIGDDLISNRKWGIGFMDIDTF